jgi:hypothetical protein
MRSSYLNQEHTSGQRPSEPAEIDWAGGRNGERTCGGHAPAERSDYIGGTPRLRPRHAGQLRRRLAHILQGSL